MKPIAQSSNHSGPLWIGVFFLHSAIVWITLEACGNNYMWVMDAQNPWIKDTMGPPLSTIMNLPTGLASGGCAIIAGLVVSWLRHRCGFQLRMFLPAAAAATFVAVMLRWNFIVITGPFGVRADNWHIRPLAERIAISTAATAVLVLIEGAAIYGWLLARRPADPNGPAPLAPASSVGR